MLRDSVHSSGYKAPIKTPKCTFTTSQWARWDSPGFRACLGKQGGCQCFSGCRIFWRHNGGGSHLFSQKPVCIFKQTFIQALKRAGDWQKNPKSQVNGSIHSREVWPENPSARVTTTALLLEAVEAAAARHSQSHVPERIEKPLWKQHGGSKEGHRPHTTAASHC